MTSARNSNPKQKIKSSGLIPSIQAALGLSIPILFLKISPVSLLPVPAGVAV